MKSDDNDPKDIPASFKFLDKFNAGNVDSDSQTMNAIHLFSLQSNPSVDGKA